MAARQALAPPRRPPPGPAAAVSRTPAAQRQRALQPAADKPTLRHDFGRIALLAPGGVQAKRNGPAGGDACERQADQVAEQVAGGAPPRGPLDAVPAAAAGRPHEALVPRGSGQTLAPALRGDMEARLGHDFGHVRIHADAGAAQAARAIDARAYAAGHDIVFAAGQYAPETPAGRGLLAHELTHVVQQSRSGAVVPLRKGLWGAIGGFFNSFFHIAFDYSDKAIRKYLKVLEDTHQIEGDPDSDDMARQIVRDGRHRGLSLEIRTLLVAEMLDGPTLGADERAIIAILRSATAAERPQIVASLGRDGIWENFSGDNLRAVQALTLTAADLQDAALVAKLEALSESELAEVRKNAEDAAVQVALDRMLSRKRHELGSYPEAERRAISQVDSYFGAGSADSFSADLEAAKLQQNKSPAVNQTPTSGAVTYREQETVDVPDLPLPAGVAIEFETRIAKANRPGLERIARHLLQDDPGGRGLPPNLTRNLAIREMGMVFRFTRFAHAGEGGATELVLIEEVGPLPPAAELQAADWDVRQRRPGAMGAGDVSIRAVDIRRDVDWTEPEWRAVADALQGFPDSVLKDLAGVTFKRRPCPDEFIVNGVCIPREQRPTQSEAGNRGVGTDGKPAITLFNNAFDTSPTRYGVSTLLVNVVAHEVGHQVDLRPLDEALGAFETGLRRIEAERDAALAQPEPRTKDKGRKKPAKSPHDLAWDKYSADRAALQAALDGARGLSGVAWQDDGRTRTRTEAPADADGDFLKAAIADGLKLTQERVTSGSITDYASKNVVEQFADLFAMYLTDPELLQAIRPQVFAYFSRRFPR